MIAPWRKRCIYEWRVGDVYEGPGEGLWRVVRVSEARAMMAVSDPRNHHTAHGTVILMNDTLGWEIVAPQNHERLRVLKPWGAV